jgi:hypothetical protein
MQLILVPMACVVTVGMFLVLGLFALQVIDAIVDWWKSA